MIFKSQLGHTVLDAVRTKHQKYLVICGANKLVRRAIDYLNEHQNILVRNLTIGIDEMES